MSTNNLSGEGYLNKHKKTVSRFKNHKRRFNESAEMQDNRARRINFKNYLRELEELEAQEQEVELNENEE